MTHAANTDLIDSWVIENQKCRAQIHLADPSAKERVIRLLDIAQVRFTVASTAHEPSRLSIHMRGEMDVERLKVLFLLLDEFGAAPATHTPDEDREIPTSRITKLDIEARRWFDEEPGNTYHSILVTIYTTGEDPTTYRSGVRYGYDDAYLQTAQDLLDYLGYASPKRYDNGFCEPFRKEIKRLGIEVNDTVETVDLRADLHAPSGVAGFKNLDCASEQKQRVDAPIPNPDFEDNQ